jgi:hypothetical protein
MFDLFIYSLQAWYANSTVYEGYIRYRYSEMVIVNLPGLIAFPPVVW